MQRVFSEVEQCPSGTRYGITSKLFSVILPMAYSKFFKLPKTYKLRFWWGLGSGEDFVPVRSSTGHSAQSLWTESWRPRAAVPCGSDSW